MSHFAYGSGADGFTVFPTVFVTVGTFVGLSSSVNSFLASTADTTQMPVHGDF